MASNLLGMASNLLAMASDTPLRNTKPNAESETERRFARVTRRVALILPLVGGSSSGVGLLTPIYDSLCSTSGGVVI